MSIAGILFACASLSAQAQVASEPAGPEFLPVGMDVMPFVGASSAGAHLPRAVSINIGGGLSGGTRGVEMSSGFGINQGDVVGAQLAGGFNAVTGSVRGAQLAGGFNVAADEVRGAQLAGGINVANGLRGAQLAAVNMDVARGRGAQLGVLNLTQGMDGAQIGVLNVSSEEVSGLQMGIVNLSPRADAGVGLVNVYWKGFLQVEALTSEDGLALTGVRHGSGAIYNVYYGGMHPLGSRIDPAFGFGIGVRGDASERVELAMDLVSVRVVGERLRDLDLTTKLRALMTVDLQDDVALFGGPTLSLRNAEGDAERFAPVEVWTLSAGKHDFTAWPGITAGLRFL